MQGNGVDVAIADAPGLQRRSALEMPEPELRIVGAGFQQSQGMVRCGLIGCRGNGPAQDRAGLAVALEYAIEVGEVEQGGNMLRVQLQGAAVGVLG